MNKASTDFDVAIPHAQLATLMPLHLLLGPDGVILGCGPTLVRVAGALTGQPFFDVFEVERPRGIFDIDGLRGAGNATLRLHLMGEKPTDFRAVCVPTPGGQSAFLINLSFGIAVAEAVTQHGLTLSDFASTDLAVEMLYILEAKSASMAATRELIGRLEDARSDAETRSLTDALTGLPNRRGFEKQVFRLTDLGEPFSVMAIDLDYFKAVNDLHGHAVGDAVLKEAAARLSSTLRDMDIVARIGGDEFLAVLKGIDSDEPLIAIGERMIAELSAPIMVDGIECKIGASIGIARVDGDGSERAGVMIDRADSALYESKRAGRGAVTMATA